MTAEGQITIRAYAVDYDAHELSEFTVSTGAEPGRYVLMAVDDTGHGMDAQMQARAFDPFFSTKFAGRGLGLASVLGIVRSHHGALRLWSEAGRGTSVQVALPAVTALHKAVASSFPPASNAWMGSGRVLLIDDDELVRKVIARQLKRFGFEVVQAAGGREGLDRFAEPGPKFRAVVLDRTMPGMSGEQTLLQLRELDAEVPVLLISGYSAESIDVDDPHVAFLQKPMTEAALREALHGLLESDATAAAG